MWQSCWIRAVAAVVVCLWTCGNCQAQFGEGAAKKKKEEKPKKPKATVVEERTNLDKGQLEAFAKLEKAFKKLYGHPDPLREEDTQRLREVVFKTVDGLHSPDRKYSDRMTDQFTDTLRGRVVVADDALELVREAAELLGEDEISREGLDGLIVDARKTFSGTELSAERVKEIVDTFEELVKSAKKNKDKAKAREEEAKRKEEKEAKDKARKIEEEKKKQKAKAGASGRAGRSGSSRGGTSR